MFRYGKTNGYLAILLIALGVLPVVLAAILVPQMADSIPTQFDAAGNVTRWGSRFDLLYVPALCFLLSAGTCLTAFRQARLSDDSHAIAAMTFRRYVRNGLVTSVIINVLNAYMMISAMTGTAYLPF